ncbi:ATP-binding protein [Tepidiforma flava]|uniref:histidine kinase n=1 Tax=Tepidiforma flava TaxID=3004094 RepID=A0ABY7M6W6_9CHLR|nr:ATP-binding protein [Tepidiforma flava]WBL35892.1 ATP-binding protein [Tepidiforma flava]
MPPFFRSIRFRLTVWYSSLLLVFGVAFVVALNLAVRFDQPRVFELSRSNDVVYTPVRTGPAQAIVVPIETETYSLREVEDGIYSHSLDRLQYWSLVSVLGLAIASGIGGYVLSGVLLRPVRDITEAASEISATNLSRRINYQGPRDELWALADTFDSMIGRLEASFERQRQFVQDASHELRTPLAAIRTNIEVTEMDPDASLEEYRELVATIKSQTERLTRLSEDLLLLTNDDGARVEREAVDLPALAADVIAELQPLAAQRGVALRRDIREPAEALASPDLLHRCVLNLVDNAIKYSGEGSTVTVRVADAGKAARVEVEDNGPGIPAEALPHIFDRFYRVDKGRSRREGGTGLGLAIVKELIEAMGGSVGVRSEPGSGSTFWIELPKSQESADSPAPAPRGGALAWEPGRQA